MSDERGPAQVFSIAECLGDEMQARGWTTDDVAARYTADPFDIPMAAFEIALLISVTKMGPLSKGCAERLSRAFDVSAEFFLNIDAVWQRWPDRRSPYSAPNELFGPIVRQGLDGAKTPTNPGAP